MFYGDEGDDDEEEADCFAISSNQGCLLALIGSMWAKIESLTWKVRLDF